MTIAKLKQLISQLPDSTKVEILASEANEEFSIRFVEYYEKAGCIILMDSNNEEGAGSKVLLDERGE